MPIKKILNDPEQWVAYFGYGSLVNDRTRNLESFGLAGRLQGFRRQWRMRSKIGGNANPAQGGATSLNVIKDADSAIDGLLIFDHKDHLPLVDQRERNYRRIAFDLAEFETSFDIPHGVETYIYLGEPDYRHWAQEAYPVLQSYCDAVMQGFLEKFGHDGLERFMAESDGWQRPLLQDRGDPLYPRAVVLTQSEKDLFDQLLVNAGAHPRTHGR
ncbi:MAG: gamma-glutamylcyclotransferase [Cohaesibacter sp.]|nr:gamma-glutamylcyclotransferase [Cohaesibacter sp.]